MFEGNFQFYFNVFVPFIVEMLVACFVLTKKKTNFRFKPYITLPISAVVVFGVALLLALGLGHVYQWTEFFNILVYTLMVATVFGALMFIYKLDIKEAILIVAIAHTFEHIGYQMTTICLDTGLSEVLYKTYDMTKAGNIYQVLSILFKIVFIVGAAFTIGRFFLKLQKRQLSLVISIVFIAVIYLIVVVVNVLVVQRASWMLDKVAKSAVALTFVTVCVLFDMFVIMMLRSNEAERDLIIMKNTRESRYQQFEIMDKNINYINMKCHDLRKQLRLMNSKKEQLTDDDFKLLIDSLNFFDTDVKTGSPNIDSFIQERILYCKSLGIDFTSLVDGKGFGKMAPSDTYFLLMNIVDNAIDAARQITKEDEKVISLTAYEKQGVLIIEETNYFVGKIDIKPDGTIKSKREGNDFHGYGTKSIAYIVNKYDGKVEYAVDKNIFKLRIVI